MQPSGGITSQTWVECIIYCLIWNCVPRNTMARKLLEYFRKRKKKTMLFIFEIIGSLF